MLKTISMNELNTSNLIYHKFIFGISLLYGCIFICIIIHMVNRYYIKKKDAGKLITTIKCPLAILVRKIASYILMFIILNTRVSTDVLFILPDIYSFIALILFAWFDLQPQQIYQKGILVSTGFIKWSEIQYVESPDIRNHMIVVKLKKRRFRSNTFKIYCFHGLATNFIDLITERLNDDILS